MLKEPVPQQNKHETCEWYFPTTTREQAEVILSQMPNDGSFLVRPSDKGQNTFVISFKYDAMMLRRRLASEMILLFTERSRKSSIV